MKRTGSVVPTVHPLSSASASPTAISPAVNSATVPSTGSGSIAPALAAGSSTVTWRVRLSIETGPTAMLTAWSTSGSASTASTMPGLSPPPPN